MSQSIINCVLKQFSPEELASNKELQSAIKELKTLKGADARSRAIELANDFNLSIEKQINRAHNLSEINTRWGGLVDDIASDKVPVKEGVERLRKFAAEGVHHYAEGLSGEIVAPLQSVINKMQPEGLLRVFGSKMGEYDVLSAFYGKGGKSAEGQAVADALNNWLGKVHQVLVDSGLRSPSEKFTSFIPISISDRKLAKMNAAGFKKLVTELIDPDHFNSTAKEMIRKLGGLDQYFDEVKKAYTIGRLGAKTKVSHVDLMDSFENALKASSPEAWLELNEGLGRDALAVTLLEQSERIGRQAARYTLLGSEKDAGKLIARSVSKLAEAGKLSVGEATSLKKALETTAFHHFGKWRISAEGFNTAAKIGTYAVSTLQDIGAASRLIGVVVDTVLVDKVSGFAASVSNGLGTNWKAIAKSMPLVPYKTERDQVISAALGLNLIRDKLSTVIRNVDSMTGFVTTRKTAAAAYRIGGINHFTNKNRLMDIYVAFNEMGLMAKNLPWEKIDTALQSALKNHHIVKADWDILSKHMQQNALADITGMLHSSDKAIRNTARKFVGYGYDYMEQAVPTSNFRFQAQKAAFSSHGQTAATATKSITSMMSWAASFTQANILTPFRSSGWRAIPRIGAVLGAMWVLNSFRNDVLDLIKGKNPLPFSSGERWQRAATQTIPFIGGVLWELISGDRQNAGMSAGGLPYNMAKDIIMSTLKFGRGILDDSKSGNYAIIKTFFDNVPKTAYTALLTRAIQDQIMLMLAPDAYTKLARDNARQAKLGGYWWQRGSTTPNAPSFKHMFQ